MSKKKLELTREDSELFREAIQGTEPIRQNKHKAVRPTKKPRLKQPESQHTPNHFEFASDTILQKISPDDWLNAEDSMHFARSGIPLRTLSKLKRGKMRPEAKLDLHGHTRDEAIAAATRFIQQCTAQAFRQVLMVHGKGNLSAASKPLLKNLLNHWLREQPQVLAFCSASARDGGRGALYVLLKRGHKE